MSLNNRQLEFKGWIKRQFFDKSGVLNFDDLELKAAALAALLFQDLGEIDISEVVQELTKENTVEMALGDSLVDKATFRPWIAERRSITETKRWDAYKRLLID